MSNNSVFSKSLAIFLLAFLLSTPFILNGIFTERLPSAWIGFWGSFAGGILGTLGVIYVAYLQNIEQQKQNEIIMDEQRRMNNSQISAQLKRFEQAEMNTRERMKIQNDLDLINRYLDDLKNMTDELNKLEGLVTNYAFHKNNVIKSRKNIKMVEKNSKLKSIYDQSRQELHKISSDLSNYHEFYLLNVYSNLIYLNLDVNQINKSKYKNERPKQNHITNISDLIHKIKMDHELSNNVFEELDFVKESFGILLKWSQKEIPEAHIAINNINLKLTADK